MAEMLGLSDQEFWKKYANISKEKKGDNIPEYIKWTLWLTERTGKKLSLRIYQ